MSIILFYDFNFHIIFFYGREKEREKEKLFINCSTFFIITWHSEPCYWPNYFGYSLETLNIEVNEKLSQVKKVLLQLLNENNKLNKLPYGFNFTSEYIMFSILVL